MHPNHRRTIGLIWVEVEVEVVRVVGGLPSKTPPLVSSTRLKTGPSSGTGVTTEITLRTDRYGVAIMVEVTGR